MKQMQGLASRTSVDNLGLKLGCATSIQDMLVAEGVRQPGEAWVGCAVKDDEGAAMAQNSEDAAL